MSQQLNFTVRYCGADVKRETFEACMEFSAKPGDTINLVADDDPMLWEHIEHFVKKYGLDYKFTLITDGKTFKDIRLVHELGVKLDTIETAVAKKLGITDLDKIIANTTRFRNLPNLPVVIHTVDFGQAYDSLERWAKFFDIGFVLQPMTPELAKQYPTTKI